MDLRVSGRRAPKPGAPQSQGNMPARVQYLDPPVVRASCQFVFDPTSTWEGVIPDLFYERVRDEFPRRREIKERERRVEIMAEEGDAKSPQAPGHQFTRTDRTAHLQVGVNSLAVVHRRPYPSWEGFVSLIRMGLRVYQEVAKPKGFDRIKLNYTNSIDFPGRSVDLEDYFDLYPFLGPRLPRTFNNFLFGLRFPFAEGRDVLQVLMTEGDSEDLDTTSVTLTLTYFLKLPADIELEDMFYLLDEAHMRLEEIFEGSLKDTLRDRFMRREA